MKQCFLAFAYVSQTARKFSFRIPETRIKSPQRRTLSLRGISSSSVLFLFHPLFYSSLKYRRLALPASKGNPSPRLVIQPAKGSRSFLANINFNPTSIHKVLARGTNCIPAKFNLFVLLVYLCSWKTLF